jgi:hypothetical protein
MGLLGEAHCAVSSELHDFPMGVVVGFGHRLNARALGPHITGPNSDDAPRSVVILILEERLWTTTSILMNSRDVD